MLQKLPIKSFDNFIRKVRRIAFETPFKINKKEKLVKQVSEEDIEKILSFKEVKILVLDEFVQDYDDDYVIIENTYEQCSKILEAVVSRLINNELSKMASEGELECYFDDEINDFRFKIKKNKS